VLVRRYPIPNSRWAAPPPAAVPPAEECAADCPPVLDAAVDVNSPLELDPAAGLESPAAPDPPPVDPLPTEAALALDVSLVEADDEVEDDWVPAKARSGPNSRLASSAGGNATADAAVGRRVLTPSECVSPDDAAPVSR